MQVLMLSSSRYADHPYLGYAQDMLKSHFANISELIFIPYAGVTLDYDDYTQKVQEALPWLNVTGLHTTSDPVAAVNHAQAIAVGGGNTFHLLHELYALQLIEPIQTKVKAGMPYAGWSAGSNICGASIRTTNDMPIIEPPSFAALGFLPFQLNPHYSDYHPPGFHGETRDQRLQEFCVVNPSTPVVAIREGSALKLDGKRLTLEGDLDGFIFLGQDKIPVAAQSDLSHLL